MQRNALPFQLDQYHQTSDKRWEKHATDKRPGQPYQIFASGPPTNAAEDRSRDSYRNQAGKQPIDLFDRLVRIAHLDKFVLRAARPAVATET